MDISCFMGGKVMSSIKEDIKFLFLKWNCIYNPYRAFSEVAVITINDDIRGEDFVAYMVLENHTELSKIIEIIHHERPSVEWPKSSSRNSYVTPYRMLKS